MRIPPYYQNRSWQRFLAGVFIGAIVGWLIFLFMFGQLQNNQVSLILEQQLKIRDLEYAKEIWQKDYEKWNEENQKKLKIEEINIYFTNEKRLLLNEYIKYQLQEAIKADIKTLIKMDIESVAKNNELIIKTIENKIITIEGQKYQMKVHQFHLFTRLDLYLKIELLN